MFVGNFSLTGFLMDERVEPPQCEYTVGKTVCRMCAKEAVYHCSQEHPEWFWRHSKSRPLSRYMEKVEVWLKDRLTPQDCLLVPDPVDWDRVEYVGICARHLGLSVDLLICQVWDFDGKVFGPHMAGACYVHGRTNQETKHQASIDHLQNGAKKPLLS